MKTSPKLLSFIFILSVLVMAQSAWAQKTVVWLDVGAKGAIGGNYLTEPVDVVPGVTAPFYEGAGGIGGGGGIFGDIRFLKQYIGLEVDLLIDANKNWCNITYGNTVDVRYIYKNTALRIPMLLKGSLVKNNTRVSLGIGPEIRVGMNAKTDVEITDGKEHVSDLEEQLLKDFFSATPQLDVALAWELGLAFAIENITITLDMRFTYNFTLSKEYFERIDASADYTHVDIQAAHTLDGRILLGVGYIFEFKK